MRTGAIFARGSCRALKWLALLGVVLALGAGSAVAQISIKGPNDTTVRGNDFTTVTEGDVATYTVTVRGYVPAVEEDEQTAELTLALNPVNGRVRAHEDGDLVIDQRDNVGVKSVDITIPGYEEDDQLFSHSVTFRLQTFHDADAEDEAVQVTISLTDVSLFTEMAGGGVLVGNGPEPFELRIDDDEEQHYRLRLPDDVDPMEGEDFRVILEADPPHEGGSQAPTAVDGAISLTVISDRDEEDGWEVATPVTLGGAVGTVPNQTRVNEAEVLVQNPDNDRDREEDTITLEVYSGQAGAEKLEDSLTITVADAHELPDVGVTVVDAEGNNLNPQPTMVEEGETLKVRVRPLNKTTRNVMAAPERLRVTLTPDGSSAADTNDYGLSAPIAISQGARNSNIIDLMIEMDEDVGMETLVFNATVAGEDKNGTETSVSLGVLQLDIVDATEKKIWPKADAEATINAAIAEGGGEDGLNPEPSESFVLMMSDLFELMDGYTADYDPSVEGDAISYVDVGDGSVTIMAEEAGMAKVTVTGVASMASSSFMPEQTVSNVASITFDVMVTDTMLTVELSADPMEIMEGEMSTITAMANRNVTSGDGDVMVALSVVGDGMLDMDSITIPMGMMSGTAMLTATEDDDDYMDETVTVVATGSGIMDSTQVEVMVMDNDMAPTTVSAKSQEQVDAVFAVAIADARSGSDWTTGDGAAMVDMSMLFDMAEGAMPSYSGMSNNDMVVSTSSSGAMLTLMPMGAGMATITVTATDPASLDVATAMSDVMVMLDGLTYTVMADEMNLVEDMDHENGTKTSATVTVMASRELAEGEMAEIMLMRDGSSTASMDDYTVMPEMVTLMAGDMEATFTVMAVEDNMPDGGAGMPEMLTLFVSLNGMQMTDKSVMFYLWDHAVPALPIIAQLLLAAFLAIGGYRRYRRR